MSATRPASGPFSPAEWGAIAAVILIWGSNNVAAKLAVSELSPLMVGGLRFALAAPILLLWVRPPFPPWPHLLLLAALTGPLHFGLIYTGFALSEHLSAFVVSLQLWIPMTAVFAALWLKEAMSGAAVGGLLLAFLGVAGMTLDPHVVGDAAAIGVGFLASTCWAAATVLVRRTPDTRPLTLQGVTAIITAPCLLLAAFSQPGAVAQVREASGVAWGTVVWAGLMSTIVGTGLMFWLVQRREASRVTPYFLLTPVVSGVLGVMVLGDRITPQVLAGGAATLAGVALVALADRRRNRRATAAAAVALNEAG